MSSMVHLISKNIGNEKLKDVGADNTIIEECASRDRI